MSPQQRLLAVQRGTVVANVVVIIILCICMATYQCQAASPDHGNSDSITSSRSGKQPSVADAAAANLMLWSPSEAVKAPAMVAALPTASMRCQTPPPSSLKFCGFLSDSLLYLPDMAAANLTVHLAAIDLATHKRTVEPALIFSTPLCRESGRYTNCISAFTLCNATATPTPAPFAGVCRSQCDALVAACPSLHLNATQCQEAHAGVGPPGNCSELLPDPASVPKQDTCTTPTSSSDGDSPLSPASAPSELEYCFMMSTSTIAQFPVFLGPIQQRDAGVKDRMQLLDYQLPNNECSRVLRYFLCQQAFPVCSSPAHPGTGGGALRACGDTCHSLITTCGENVASFFVPGLDCSNPGLFGAPGECGNLTIPAAASCPANCSYPTGGACLADGTCQCKPSFFGVDCTSQYCEGNTVLEVAPFQAHQPSQPGRLPSFQPSPTGSFMRYRSRCSWLLSVIDPATGQQPSHGHITLDWSEFGTNQGSVYVYNGNSTAKDHLLRQFTSVPVFQPARNEAEVIGPVMSIVPQLTVVLQADALSFTPCVGFVANYTAGCLPSCSSPGGYCDNGRCVCKYGWYGIDCSLPMCRELAIITPQDERGTPAEQHMIQDHRHPLPAGTYGRHMQDCYFFFRATGEDGDLDPSQRIKFDVTGINLLLDDLPTSEFVLYDGGLVSSAVLFQVNTWDLQGKTPKPLPLLTSGPELLVHFESRLEVDKYTASMNLGMNATFDWVTVAPGAPCVGGCTSPQAGTCVNGVCQCNAGYFGADCGQAHCNGQVLLTQPQGVIKDHSAPTVLPKGAKQYYFPTCSWLIRPDPATAQSSLITLELTSWAVQNDYLEVTVYAGDSTSAPTLASYNADQIVGSKTFIFVPPVGTRSSSMLVVFGNQFPESGMQFGDAAFNNGFIAKYTTDPCPNKCQNQGWCTPNGCLCYPGLSGVDCSISHCAGTVVRHAPWGTIADSSTSYDFLAASGSVTRLCHWLIQPTASPGDGDAQTRPITLTFEELDLSVLPLATVTVYDGPTTDAPLIANYTGRMVPPSVQGTESTMLVQFRLFSRGDNYQGIWGHGFRATYSAGSCTDCGFGGICALGQCVCKTDATLEWPNCVPRCPLGKFGPRCDQAMCNGTTSLLTDPSGGTLTNGAGEEMPPVLTNVLLAARPEPCRWLIRPDMPHGEAVRITLYFPYWNMLQYSALRVFDGATEQAPLLRSYVRNEFVLKHPLPVTSSGSELLVVYQGDTTSVGDGKFLAYYNVTRAPTCVADCGATLTVNGLPSGTCEDGVCICKSGFYGADCGVRRCSGRALIKDRSGSFRPNSNRMPWATKISEMAVYCWWVIQPQGLTVAQRVHLQLEFGHIDILAPDVFVFDGPDARSPLLLATPATANIDVDVSLKPPRRPIAITSSGPALTVMWRSDDFSAGDDVPGFVASFTSGDMAPPFAVPPQDSLPRVAGSPGSGPGSNCLACVEAGYAFCAPHYSNQLHGFCSFHKAPTAGNITAAVRLTMCGNVNAVLMVEECPLSLVGHTQLPSLQPIIASVSCQECVNSPSFGLCTQESAPMPGFPGQYMRRLACLAGTPSGPSAGAAVFPDPTCANGTWRFNATGPYISCAISNSLGLSGLCDVAYTCLNGGTCMRGTGVCSCAEGFGGVQCEYPMRGVSCRASGSGASPALCQSGSHCSTSGQCVCGSANTGPLCELAIYGYDVPSTFAACADEITCSRHGTCAPYTGQCICDPGWGGLFCEFPTASNGDPRWVPASVHANPPAVTCSDNAVLDVTTRDRCLCPRSFTGIDCSAVVNWGWFTNNCLSSARDCSGHGSCTLATGRCVCEQGWLGLWCEFEARFPRSPPPASKADCAEGAWDPVRRMCYCTSSFTGAYCSLTTKIGGIGFNSVVSKEGCMNEAACFNGGWCNLKSGMCMCPAGDTPQTTPAFGGSRCEYPALFNQPWPKPASATADGAGDDGKAHCIAGVMEASSGACVCGNEWTGTLCNIPQHEYVYGYGEALMGVGCTEDAECGAGFCNTYNGFCVCPSSHRGARCEFPFELSPTRAPGVPTLAQVNCSGNPEQESGGLFEYGSGACVCRRGRTGAACHLEVAAIVGACNVTMAEGQAQAQVQSQHPCCGNGACVALKGPASPAGVCLCAPGFGGQRCEYASASRLENGTRRSECHAGYWSVGTQACVCPRNATGSDCSVRVTSAAAEDATTCAVAWQRNKPGVTSSPSTKPGRFKPVYWVFIGIGVVAVVCTVLAVVLVVRHRRRAQRNARHVAHSHVLLSPASGGSLTGVLTPARHDLLTSATVSLTKTAAQRHQARHKRGAGGGASSSYTQLTG